jgi:hypothetical protein
MKTIQNLGRTLTKLEQKNIVGGAVRTTCTCEGSVGEWFYDTDQPVLRSTLIRDVQTYCRSGSGRCSARLVADLGSTQPLDTSLVLQ